MLKSFNTDVHQWQQPSSSSIQFLVLHAHHSEWVGIFLSVWKQFQPPNKFYKRKPYFCADSRSAAQNIKRFFSLLASLQLRFALRFLSAEIRTWKPQEVSESMKTSCCTVAAAFRKPACENLCVLDACLGLDSQVMTRSVWTWQESKPRLNPQRSLHSLREN